MKEGRDIAVPERLKKCAQTKTCFIFYDIDADVRRAGAPGGLRAHSVFPEGGTRS